MEIYNEEINDLLAVENQRLQIHEHLEVGWLVGSSSQVISSPLVLFRVIKPTCFSLMYSVECLLPVLRTKLLMTLNRF